jgi:hypothetical protein
MTRPITLLKGTAMRVFLQIIFIFVAAVSDMPVSAQTAQAPAWRVDFGGVPQNGYPDGNTSTPPMQYFPLHYTRSPVLHGVAFSPDYGTVTIQSPGTYVMTWQTWASAGVGGSNPYTVTKLLVQRAGTSGFFDVQGCTSIGTLGFNGTSPAASGCIDDAAAGDSYVLEFTGTAQCPSCTITVDGNPAHSFWGGARVGD